MNMALKADSAGSSLPKAQVDPDATGFEPFEGVADQIEDLAELMLDLGSLCEDSPDAARALRKLQTSLVELEPSVTMIGQVKAGKTSLVNAMIGRPDFLPADVNPWTSVVTSLHLNAAKAEGAPAASFQLFREDEWDKLLQNGGRLGELARNANADEELKKIHAQISEMREKTRARLGRKFELLLGQKHDFDEISEDLIQSYVCMGDDPEYAGPEDVNQGRFADITKSADIFLDAPHIPVPLCIRDTPGVNDTFLMREQITINALRSSRLCVVVLSAHQALTTTDMAMIRMISNVKARDLVIFVNRIDDLPDPVGQIDEVRDAIRATLEEHGGPKNVQIVFGSALWANLAVQRDTASLEPESITVMRDLARERLGERAKTATMDELAWVLSGVPDLFAALGDRVAEGEAAEAIATVRKQGRNIAKGLLVSNSMVSLRLNGDAIKPIERHEIEQRLDRIEADARDALEARLGKLETDFRTRIDRVSVKFLDRALETLLQHLDTKGQEEVWHYSADGLRLLLRSSFLVLAKNYDSTCCAIYQSAAQDLTAVYQQALNVTAEGFEITPPDVPKVPPPVTLGATIALDLSTSWWNNLWRRRKGAKGLAEHYRTLIEAEIAPLIEQLNASHVQTIRASASETLESFLDAQGGQLIDLCAQTELSEDHLKRAFGVVETKDCEEILQSLIEDLS